MAERLCSVGLDVGTTSTQLVVSELTVENQASSFAVPQLQITQRQLRYQSEVYFTPLIGEGLVDGAGIREIVEKEYARAGICPGDVDTGAVIITGETSRRENARQVLDALSAFAGEFVVATAGPHLESVLAAKGAGATDFSEKTGKQVLHMDIGGGTSNLALIENGNIMSTACLNVGGRLVKFDEQDRITYVSPALKELCKLTVGQIATPEALRPVAKLLTEALEMAAGLREVTSLLEKLNTREAGDVPKPPAERVVVSFSGGVADCIETTRGWRSFGDLGPILGEEIRKSRLCQGQYRLGDHTIRATVIGAGCHSVRLSGSTVFCRNVRLPLKNLPVVQVTSAEQELTPEELGNLVESRLSQQDTDSVLALPGFSSPGYHRVVALAEGLSRGLGGRPAYVALEQDMAKALGQAMALRLPKEAGIVCLDSLKLSPGSYLDIGEPVGPALPVVIKTLVLQQ
ncbi:MAG: ethanolamine ammonia-lyase reactivating factor EutA [Oscillospiraceae bacterium]|nr:ethanolamine ammonia-lyase reactivating factor EutA [Oscillospiraceae bacterium]